MVKNRWIARAMVVVRSASPHARRPNPGPTPGQPTETTTSATNATTDTPERGSDARPHHTAQHGDRRRHERNERRGTDRTRRDRHDGRAAHDRRSPGGSGGRHVRDAHRRQWRVHGRAPHHRPRRGRILRARVRRGRHGDVVHVERAHERRALDVHPRWRGALPDARPRADAGRPCRLQRHGRARVAQREWRGRRQPRVGGHPRGGHPGGSRVGRRVGADDRRDGRPRPRADELARRGERRAGSAGDRPRAVRDARPSR